nr:hypothetical protein [Tanacetum cinerariifolium]
TWVEVIRKHRYGYLREIEVRRTNNDLYMFKEGDFPRLRINDIEDMLLLGFKLRWMTSLRKSEWSTYHRQDGVAAEGKKDNEEL